MPGLILKTEQGNYRGQDRNRPPIATSMRKRTPVTALGSAAEAVWGHGLRLACCIVNLASWLCPTSWQGYCRFILENKWQTIEPMVSLCREDPMKLSVHPIKGYTHPIKSSPTQIYPGNDERHTEKFRKMVHNDLRGGKCCLCTMREVNMTLSMLRNTIRS